MPNLVAFRTISASSALVIVSSLTVASPKIAIADMRVNLTVTKLLRRSDLTIVMVFMIVRIVRVVRVVRIVRIVRIVRVVPAYQFARAERILRNVSISLGVRDLRVLPSARIVTNLPDSLV